MVLQGRKTRTQGLMDRELRTAREVYQTAARGGQEEDNSSRRQSPAELIRISATNTEIRGYAVKRGRAEDEEGNRTEPILETAPPSMRRN